MRCIESDDAPLEFSEKGGGVPVILLHSTGSSGAQWRALASELSERHRVIVPNLYGYGRTPIWRGRGRFTLAREVDLLVPLLEHAGEPAHIVGHSYGGAVALHMARARPRSIRSLTMIEPATFHLLLDGSAADQRAYARIRSVACEVWRSLATGDYENGARTFVDYWSGAGSWRAMPPRQQLLTMQRMPKIGLDFHATLHDAARAGDFGALAAPMLLMRSESTTTVAVRVAARLGAMFPQACRHRLSEGGHMAPVSHPREVNAAIHAQLRTWDSGYADCLRQVAGGMPNSRRNARLNAVSVS
ncbi:MAG: alpha/beta fold hydrolase [Ramlibacter sp.]|nr:alpha/beta fold hydrolase [Ramlibacter sp.]